MCHWSLQVTKHDGLLSSMYVFVVAVHCVHVGASPSVSETRCPSPRREAHEATVQSGCWDWLKECIHTRNCLVGCLWSMLRQLTPSSLKPCEDSRLLEVITFPEGTREYSLLWVRIIWGEVHPQVCGSSFYNIIFYIYWIKYDKS